MEANGYRVLPAFNNHSSRRQSDSAVVKLVHGDGPSAALYVCFQAFEVFKSVGSETQNNRKTQHQHMHTALQQNTENTPFVEHARPKKGQALLIVFVCTIHV